MKEEIKIIVQQVRPTKRCAIFVEQVEAASEAVLHSPGCYITQKALIDAFGKLPLQLEVTFREIK